MISREIPHTTLRASATQVRKAHSHRRVGLLFGRVGLAGRLSIRARSASSHLPRKWPVERVTNARWRCGRRGGVDEACKDAHPMPPDAMAAMINMVIAARWLEQARLHLWHRQIREAWPPVLRYAAKSGGRPPAMMRAHARSTSYATRICSAMTSWPEMVRMQ